MTWVSRTTNTATASYWTACAPPWQPPAVPGQHADNHRAVARLRASTGRSRITITDVADLNLVATIATGVASSFPAGLYKQPDWIFTAQVPARFTMRRIVGGSIPDGGPAAKDLPSAKGRVILEKARDASHRAALRR